MLLRHSGELFLNTVIQDKHSPGADSFWKLKRHLTFRELRAPQLQKKNEHNEGMKLGKDSL